MSYIALYRKWRPGNFDEVKGQDAIVRTLRNQILYDRIGHAYLFCGTRGTGKTSIAKLFAKAVNCQNPQNGNPCNACPTCQAINAGSSLDVIEIDAASNNGVDHIREIRDQVQYAPVDGRFKVYIIDEVHMLSTGAFNALLKTLEEPPSYVMFILATTEKHKIPVTILSRCQKYDFKRISIDTITEHLKELMVKEEIPAQEKALRYIARAADGSMRDALSLLDQCISFYLGQELTYENVLEVLGTVDNSIFRELLYHILEEDTMATLRVIDDVIVQGRELSQFLSDFLWYLRNLLMLQGDASGSSLDMSSEAIAALSADAAITDSETLLRFIRILSALSSELKSATQKRVLLEIGFIKLCKPQMETSRDSLLARIKSLEDKIEKGMVVAQAPAQPAVQAAPVMENISTENVEAMLEERFEPAQIEDLRTIAKNWNKILASCPMPLGRLLQSATPSVSESSTTIQLIFSEQDDVTKTAKTYLEDNHGEHLKELSKIVSDMTKKEVTFECHVAEDVRNSNTEFIDLSKIHFPLTVE